MSGLETERSGPDRGHSLRRSRPRPARAIPSRPDAPLRRLRRARPPRAELRRGAQRADHQSPRYPRPPAADQTQPARPRPTASEVAKSTKLASDSAVRAGSDLLHTRQAPARTGHPDPRTRAALRRTPGSHSRRKVTFYQVSGPTVSCCRSSGRCHASRGDLIRTCVWLLTGRRCCTLLLYSAFVPFEICF
jgi:hypothetical protein